MKHNINENEKILPRAAVIQDMSGFVRVSLTEAIPILAAMGVEVCPLPPRYCPHIPMNLPIIPFWI